MYRYKDYFDEKKRQMPYHTAAEERQDYLRLLDMLLERCLDDKRAGRAERFSVCDVSGITDYFDTPPSLRNRKSHGQTAAEDAKKALAYIKERTAQTRDTESDTQEKTVTRIGQARRLFSLDERQLLAVLLALSVETDTSYGKLYAVLQEDRTRLYPTIGLWDALVSQAVECGFPLTDDPFFSLFFLRDENEGWRNTRLVLSPLMRRVLLEGQTALDGDDRWRSVFYQYEEEADIPVFFEKESAELSAMEAAGRIPFCYIENEDEDGVLHVLSALCRKAGQRLYVLTLRQLAPLTPEERRRCLADLILTAALGKGRVCVKYPGQETEETQTRGKDAYGLLTELEHVFAKHGMGLVYLFGESKEPGELAKKPMPFVRMALPDVRLRMQMWDCFLHRPADGMAVQTSEDVVIPDLADCYELTYSEIKNTCVLAREGARVRSGGVISRSAILTSLQQMQRVDFSGLATYVRASYTWQDIRISEEQRETLAIACDRYRLRNRIGEQWGLKKRNTYGNGVSLLLYGPPGTGKTMAAQVVARELGLSLYRVDLSRIFSKYIGETEKNLATVFDAAKRANVILFFDEADALFSKRTEVKDSNDKYANSEAAYLLQKIEEYNGMSVLATNYYKNFDSAFVRRITYFVHIGEPDEQARYALWTSILPEETPVAEDVDFHFLSQKFPLSGSNIKAILYNAAYMAGARDVPVGKEELYKALRYEYAKMGKVIDKSWFEEPDRQGQ